MQELKLLNEQEVLGKQFRVYGTPDNPLFVASDVADWIEHSNATEMLKGVDEDEKLTSTILRAGQKRLMNMLTEDGLYEVLMQSRKPIAKQFKKKVKEILKTIRKTGGYVANEDLFIETYLPYVDENTKALFKTTLTTVRKQNEVIKEQKEKLETQQPLVDFAAHVSQSKDTIDMDEMAKIAANENIKIGRNRLIKWLKEKKILKDNRTPYQKYIERGYFDVIESKKHTMYGTLVFPKTVITGKGQIWVIEKLRAEYC